MQVCNRAVASNAQKEYSHVWKFFRAVDTHRMAFVPRPAIFSQHRVRGGTGRLSTVASLFSSLQLDCLLLTLSSSYPKPLLQICTGETGHAEVIQLKYDSSKVSPTDLLEIFFKMHDPTTKNRQGADVGTQYRRVTGNFARIFCCEYCRHGKLCAIGGPLPTTTIVDGTFRYNFSRLSRMHLFSDQV